MLDLSHYASLGEALREALQRWADHVCLIEADRDRENCRLTYRQFQERALPLARALQEHGFAPDERAAIIMTNQSKWLISAYAIFYAGSYFSKRPPLTQNSPSAPSSPGRDSSHAE